MSRPRLALPALLLTLATCVLLHADLICTRARPGANLVASFRVREAPEAVAASHRFAHGLHTRFLPAA